MNKRLFFMLLLLSLLSESIFARYGGKITMMVGEERYVDPGFSSYATISGSWSKTGSCFSITSTARDRSWCKIWGFRAGTGTLRFWGLVNADDFEIIYDVEVVAPEGSEPIFPEEPSGNWLQTPDTYSVSWYNQNLSEFYLADKKELAGLAYLVNSGIDSFEGKVINLVSSVDISEHKWIPIGTENNRFCGVFNGNGYSITGIYIGNSADDRYYGFFGNCRGGFVKGTVFQGVVNVATSHPTCYIGGVAGLCDSIEYCKCNMPIYLTIDNQAIGIEAVEPSITVGGLAGYARGNIEYCSHTGNIFVSNTTTDNGTYTIGGLIGECYYGEVNFCENISSRIDCNIENDRAGFVTERQQGIGGLIGESYCTHIRVCRSIVDDISVIMSQYSCGHYYFNLSGLCGYTSYTDASTYFENSYCSVGNITGYAKGWFPIGQGVQAQAFAVRHYGSTCFRNSDMNLKFTGGIGWSNAGDAQSTFSRSSMQTSAFTMVLNNGANNLGLGDKTWGEDDGTGYPYIIELNREPDFIGEGKVCDINEENFPDPHFRDFLLSQDIGSDAMLTEREIWITSELNMENQGITDLKGIEWFASLTSLVVCNNNLTSIDISQNKRLTSLNVRGNNLKELDVSNNIWLNRLVCSMNQINGYAMDDLINSLPQNTASTLNKFYCFQVSDAEGNKCTKTQVAKALEKGWQPYYYDTRWDVYEGSDDEVGYYYVGKQNGWDITNRNYPFVKSDDGTTWSLTMNATMSDEFLIVPGTTTDWDGIAYGAENSSLSSGNVVRNEGHNNFRVPYWPGMDMFKIDLNISKMSYSMARHRSTTTTTCAGVQAGTVGKSYRVEGIVGNITNTTYGNWYLSDTTGEIYIYGTRDRDGYTGKNNSIDVWNIETGDSVIVVGEKNVYNGIVELVDVGVEKVTKKNPFIIENGIMQVTPQDSLQLAVAYAPSNTTIKLSAGNYYINYPTLDYYGGLSIQKDLTIEGEGMGVTTIHGRFDMQNGAGLTLKNLTLDGENTNQTQPIIYRDDVAYSDLVILDCEIKSYQKGFLYVNVASEINNITINNCLIHDIEGLQDFFDCRQGYYANFVLMNSTIYNCCTNGRDFFRLDDSSSSFVNPRSPQITVKQCTFYQVGNSGNTRLFYVRFEGNKISFTDNVIALFSGSRGFANVSKTDPTPTLSNNFYYKTENLCSLSSNGDESIKWFDASGTILNPNDQLFQDVENHNYRVLSQAVIKSKAGDPRWLKDEMLGVEYLERLTDTPSDLYFDLQGRRVSQPVKRGFYIRNGKKVIFK